VCAQLAYCLYVAQVFVEYLDRIKLPCSRSPTPCIHSSHICDTVRHVPDRKRLVKRPCVVKYQAHVSNNRYIPAPEWQVQISCLSLYYISMAVQNNASMESILTRFIIDNTEIMEVLITLKRLPPRCLLH
jgi:hypothetical protein